MFSYLRSGSNNVNSNINILVGSQCINIIVEKVISTSLLKLNLKGKG